MIGLHSRLRDVMGQSYLICACTRANHARYPSVHITFCGSSKHSVILGEKNLQIESVEHIEQYHTKFVQHYLKATRT